MQTAGWEAERGDPADLVRVERNGPSRAAAGAGAVTPVRRMEAETPRHGVFHHRNPDYRNVWAGRPFVPGWPGKRHVRPARLLRCTGSRHVRTGYIRSSPAP